MPKIDKSLYTKKQIQALLAARKRQKEGEKLAANITKPNEHTDKKYGFVLGNGTSRKGVPLEKIHEFGKIYACNAVYREYDPDYLIAVDVKMILEITKKGYHLIKKNVWTNANNAYKKIEGLNFFRPSRGWSSGPTALHLASQHGYDKIFILGFDYQGLEESGRKVVNNVYAGTPNYKKTTDTATYYGNWLKQTCTIIRENPQITFYRVILPDNFIPGELNNFNNLKHIDIEEFEKMFNIR
jgi:hypothetical protein